MPRKARAVSCTHTYHIMMRGINRQQIFFDDEDNQQFIKTLGRYKEISHFKLFAYCLMGNHIHILIQAPDEPTGVIFKRIGTSYVNWYNKKYERCGHLFQDRYKSEPVEDEAYLFQVWKYILLNPVKAGLCKSAQDYPYSSAGEYFNNMPGITDTSLIKDLLQNNMAFFLSPENNQITLNDETSHQYLSDKKAIQLIQNDPMPPDEAKDALTIWTRRQIKAGISIRQLSRLSGISKYRIERLLK